MRGGGRGIGACAARGVATALAAAVLLACQPDAPVTAEQPPRPRNVFLISLDTLRKDAVGAYPRDASERRGAAGESNAKRTSNTPGLDAFARDAVLLDGARTPMPFTLPAHISLLTGVAPRVHGVSRGDRLLSADLGTLPEWLRAAGFGTHGVAVNYWMKGSFGFERGFDSYQLVLEGLVSSGRVNAALGQILDSAADAAAGDRSLFVFAQYFDAHSASSLLGQNTLPYYSPPEYRADLAATPHEVDFCDPDPEMGCATGFLKGADAAGRDLTPATLARVRTLYDRSVRHQDAQLAEFLEQLKRRGLYDDALIIVVSDHGEAFREHGLFLHSQTYDETLAIPLLVKLPREWGAGRSGQRVAGLALLEDIAPTILDVLGLPLPESVQGVSLLPLILRGEAVRELAISQDKSRRSRHALVTVGYKLIHDFESGASELYDLAADPRETRNLAPAQPQRVAALQQLLSEQVKLNTQLARRFRAGTQGEVLSDSERAALRAIGYLEEPGAH